VERAPLYGAQFHPEKSSAHGLRLLANFARICLDVKAGVSA
jgi:imidazoleglycerol phosphate synthase glutamine amidotransferase subunit HisH